MAGTPQAIKASSDLPGSIRYSLDRLGRRRRWLGAATGLAVTLTVFLITMLAAMAVDRFVVIFDDTYRLLLSGASFLLTGLAGLLLVVRPIVKRYGPVGLAWQIDRARPQLQERCTTAVELVANQDPPAIRGSEGMIDRVVREAAETAGSVSPKEVVSPAGARRWWTAALLVLAVTLGIRAPWPEAFDTLALRFILPNMDVARVSLTQVQSLTGDVTVAAGSPVTIEAMTSGRPAETATLVLRDRDEAGREIVTYVAMDPDPDPARNGYFRCVLRAAERSRQYRIRANDGQTKSHTITVVPRPAIEQLTVRIQPPRYSGLPSRTYKELPSRIVLLRRARVAFTVGTNKPVETCDLQIDGRRRFKLVPAGQERQRYVGTIDALKDVSLRIVLSDEYGFTNRQPPTARIIVRRDEAPTITIQKPSRRVVLKPQDTLPIYFTAEDDLAVRSVDLLVSVEGRPDRTIRVPLVDKGAAKIEGLARLALGDIDLGGAKRVDYQLRVRDSLPAYPGGGPQQGLSAPHTILLDSSAEPFQIQMLTSIRTQFFGGLQEMIKRLEQARGQVKPIAAALAKKQPWSPKHRAAADQAVQHLQAAQQLADQVAEGTARTDYVRTGRIVQEVSYQNIAPAEQHIVQAQTVAENDQDRAEQIKQADYQIDRAIKRLKELVGQFSQLTAYEDASTRMADAAARQEALAEMVRDLAQPPSGPEPEALDQATAKKLAEIQAKQQSLIEQAAEVLASNPNLTRPALDAETAAGKTLNQKLAELAKEQDRLLQDLRKENVVLNAAQALSKLVQAQDALVKKIASYDARLAKLGILGEKQRLGAQAGAAAVAGLKQRDSTAAGTAQGKLLGWMQNAVKQVQQRLAQTKGRKVADPDAPAKAASDAASLAKQARELADAHKAFGNLVIQADRKARQAAKKKREELKAKYKATLGEQIKKQKAVSATTGKLLAKLTRRTDTKDLVGKHDPRPPMAAAEAKLGASDATAAAAQQQVAAKRMGELAAAIRKLANDRAQDLHNRLGGQLPRLAKLAGAERALHGAIEQARKTYNAESAAAKDQAGKAAAQQRFSTKLGELAKQQQRVGADYAKLKSTVSTGATPPLAQLLKKHDPAGSINTAAAALAKADDQGGLAGAAAAAAQLDRLLAALKPLAAQKVDQLAAQTPEGALVAQVAAVEAQLKSLAGAVASAKKQADARLAAVSPGIEAKQLAQLRERHGKLYGQTAAVAQTAAKLLGGERAKPANRAVATAKEAGEALKAGKHQKTANAEGKTARHLAGLAGRLDELAKNKRNQAKQLAAELAKKNNQLKSIQQALKTGQSLAAAQKKLVGEARQALKAHASGLGALTKQMRADLLAEQKRLADRADRLAEQAAIPQASPSGEAATPKAHPTAPRAARLAHELAKALEAGKYQDVQKPGAEIVGILRDLANEMYTPLPPSPDNWDEQGQRMLVRTAAGQEAEALARQQQDLLDQLAALQKGQPHLATAVRQRAARDRTVDLGDAVELLKWQVEPLAPKVKATAEKLHELLSAKVPQLQQTAGQNLQKNKVPQAEAPMSQSAQGLTSAKKLLDQLSAQIAAAAQAQPASPQENAAELAEQALAAMQEQFQAMQAMADTTQLQPTDGAAGQAQAMLQAAAAQAQLAADSLSQTAQDFLAQSIQLGRADANTDATPYGLSLGGGSGNIRIELPDTESLNLELLGISRVQWATLPSQLRDEVIQAAEKLPPDEYRDLIKRYFRRISQQAAGKREPER